MAETLSTDPDIGAALAAIAIQAARLILPLWRAPMTVIAKADDSPVTEADRRAEALILGALARAFPGVPVVSEEDASDRGLPSLIAGRFFLVDPLDGTKAFIRGDPNFTVNIGLVEQGRPTAGAIAAPASGEVWRTGGSGLLKSDLDGGTARLVRARPWPPEGSLALISHTMAPEALEALKSRFAFERGEAMDSSIKLCRIAEGAADLYVREGPTMEWDIAAGHAVLAAAGGRLTRLDGNEFEYGKVAAGFRNGAFIARGAPDGARP